MRDSSWAFPVGINKRLCEAAYSSTIERNVISTERGDGLIGLALATRADDAVAISARKSGLANLVGASGPNSIAEFINCSPRVKPLSIPAMLRTSSGNVSFQKEYHRATSSKLTRG